MPFLVKIDDPTPKTSADVSSAYDAGYNQYPIDHPGGGAVTPKLVFFNATAITWNVVNGTSTNPGENVVDTVAPGAVWHKPVTEYSPFHVGFWPSTPMDYKMCIVLPADSSGAYIGNAIINDGNTVDYFGPVTDAELANGDVTMAVFSNVDSGWINP